MNEEETEAAAVEVVTSIINLAETTATGENQKRLQDAPYQDMRRRIIASVRVCATLPTIDIESMPTAGLRELADSYAEIYTLVAMVKQAANDDTAWANLRKGILSVQAETTH